MGNHTSSSRFSMPVTRRALAPWSCRAGLFALTLLVLPSLSVSQRGRSVSGTVTDKAGNALPGAVVQLENTVTLNIQSYIAQQDGHYRFNELNPDVDFTLKAKYRQFWSKPATLSKFSSAKDATINLVIPVD